jgi:hypothetical protein
MPKDGYQELLDLDPNGNILNYLRRGTSSGGHITRMEWVKVYHQSFINFFEIFPCSDCS